LEHARERARDLDGHFLLETSPTNGSIISFSAPRGTAG
jgi:hypothetical protein